MTDDERPTPDPAALERQRKFLHDHYLRSGSRAIEHGADPLTVFHAMAAAGSNGLSDLIGTSETAALLRRTADAIEALPRRTAN